MEPLRVKLLSARWRLLGHVRRRSTAIPANRFMASYCNTSSAGGWRGRRRITLPQILVADHEIISDEYHLRNGFDLDKPAISRKPDPPGDDTPVQRLPTENDSTYANATLPLRRLVYCCLPLRISCVCAKALMALTGVGSRSSTPRVR
ncbi:hypothetical protein PHMEG_00035149 [Phytophthora megakarya]|uniref:Uncharacterized protein n=1 Tax=Phytophthora megakarya TaxID=4795 RepID=A0A225US14_9STRA|nr:hypothetical protein PHMEG_00035149 [Phytophthora megakarya]